MKCPIYLSIYLSIYLPYSKESGPQVFSQFHGIPKIQSMLLRVFAWYFMMLHFIFLNVEKNWEKKGSNPQGVTKNHDLQFQTLLLQPQDALHIFGRWSFV